MNAAFALEGITVRYGGVTALRDVSLAVQPGRITGLIGPNGAGKTSLINAVTGVVRPASGTVRLGERRLDREPAHRIARAGVVRTYQNIRLFGALDVRTNVAAGAYARRRLADGDVRDYLRQAGMQSDDLGIIANGLPYGDQRRLEIARALAGEPAIVLLDEPAAGMNAVETAALGRTIASIATRGCGVLLIEHDLALVRSICDDIVVLNFGEVIACGAPDTIVRDPAVIEAYIGSDV